MKKLTREKIGTALLMLAVFCFFLLFFFKIHPLVLFDTDDFALAISARDALPAWQGWNPVRLLAECLAPLVTMFGAYGIDFFLKDHFLSVSLAYALTVSLFVTALMYMVYRHLSKSQLRIALLAYFLLCHFWIFRTADTNNLHMLFSSNVSCYFYYVIPNLLNCILVLWLMAGKESDGSVQRGFLQLSTPQKSLFVLMLYFAIFSNIWASIILGVYAGASALFDGIRQIREKHFSIAGFMKEHLLETSILLFWGVQQLFELSGGRASSIDSGPYWPSFMNSIKVTFAVLRSFNPMFLKSALVISALGFIVSALHREWEFFRKMLLLATALFVEAVYMIFSCARISGGYIRRPDVNYGCFFYGMLMLMLCADAILRWLPPAKTLAPLLLAIALLNCNTAKRTYAEPTMGGYSPAACMRYCNDILQQMQEADLEGRVTISLTIPSFPAAEDNWPAAIYGLIRYSDYCYKMGLTEKWIEITQYEIDFSKNAELRLYL